MTIGACLISPPRFRVLLDEVTLLCTAFSMYWEHAVYQPTQGVYYLGEFYKISREWGIRPLFFPFLVSLIHTVTGYSAYNGFVVNALAGFFSLWCFYLLLQRWFSRRLATIGMILLAAFPVWVLRVTSSGLEIVNLLFALLAFLFLDRFLVTRDSRDADTLGLTLVLLAQVRYESALFVLGILPVVMVYLRRFQTPLTYRAVLFPLLLLPVAWQRMNVSGGQYFMVSEEQSMFGFQNFLNNLKNAWKFFSETQSEYGTISILFYLSLAGFVYGSVWLVRHRRSLSPRIVGLSLAAAAVWILQAMVVFSYLLGNLTARYNLRLGVIFLLPLVFFVIFLFHVLAKKRPGLNHFLCIGSLALLLYYWPVAAKNEAGQRLDAYRNYQTALSFLKQHYSQQNILIISAQPRLYIPHRWSVVNFDYANQNRSELLAHLERHLFRDIIVIQKIAYSNNSSDPSTLLNDSFKLETLLEAQTHPEVYLRLSRVIP